MKGKRWLALTAALWLASLAGCGERERSAGGDTVGDGTYVNYTTDNLTVKAGYAPKADEKVKVTAVVTYYDKADEIIFSDSFEGDKQFGTPNVYAHSTTNPLFGRHAATPQGSTTGYPAKTLTAVSDVTVTAWYYDENKGNEDQLKFGFGINGGGNAMGIFFDSTIAALVDGNTIDHYGMRVAGTTYNSYAWGGSDALRSQGWHKFEWIISSETGMTAKIDGNVVSTHQGTVGDANAIPALTPVENINAVKKLTELRLMEGWNNNATNLGNIADKHFIDGVTVVKTGASTATTTLTSAEIPVLDTQYTTTPATVTVENSAYPKDAWIQVQPNLEELASVKVDSAELTADQWHVTTAEDAPQNASYYPVGELIVYADAFKNLSAGAHKLVLVMTSGSEHEVPVTVTKNEAHTPTKYYLSNSGNDSNDGHSEAQAWASFDKLSTVEFGPGDHIYLDATSVWSNVQFQPKGSGAKGAPIVLTKYNDSGDSSKRPILNGGGTKAKMDTSKGEHSYLAFDAWRKFYPSGTIELFNVEHWEVRGIEITNYSDT